MSFSRLFVLLVSVASASCFPQLSNNAPLGTKAFPQLRKIASYLSTNPSSLSLRDHPTDSLPPAPPTPSDIARCDAARSAFNLYTSDPVCFNLYFDTSYPKNFSCRANSNPIFPASLPYGSCCSSNSQCSSGICDPGNKVCTTSCDLDWQCPGYDRCYSCRCSAGGVGCSGLNFCALCPLFQGNFTEEVSRQSGCGSELVHPDEGIFAKVTSYEELFEMVSQPSVFFFSKTRGQGL